MNYYIWYSDFKYADMIEYHTEENFGGGEIGEFGESWTIRQNFPDQYSQIH